MTWNVGMQLVFCYVFAANYKERQPRASQSISYTLQPLNGCDICSLAWMAKLQNILFLIYLRV